MPESIHDTKAPAAWAILLAAGSGTRMADALAKAGGPGRKQYLEFEGAPLFWTSARTFTRVACVRGLVFVFPPEDLERMAGEVARLDALESLGVPWRVCAGGARRQDSVRNGLGELPGDCAAVLVHDSARPFASAGLVLRVAQALNEFPAAIPGVAVTDTIKRVDSNNLVGDTPERAALRAVQTPQGFRLDMLRKAHESAEKEGWDVTDDAMLMERCGHAVVVVDGEERNVKITTPADLELLKNQAEADTLRHPRTGWGYDVHRYVPEDEEHPRELAKARPMVLCGVAIPGAPRVSAHSDGDVALHAVTDALLSISGDGDIGMLFPDTDAANDNMPSCVFVAEALRRTRLAGYRPVHVGLTLVAQVPKLAPFKARMAAQLAQLVELPQDCVNVAATTEEGLGFTGEKRGIKAVAVVTAVPA